jgi:hypothetical protein
MIGENHTELFFPFPPSQTDSGKERAGKYVKISWKICFVLRSTKENKTIFY